jgi:hypothetical protein
MANVLGTTTTIKLALQLLTATTVPLNDTVLDPCEVPKFVPEIAIGVPGGPELEDKLMVGIEPPPVPSISNEGVGNREGLLEALE